MNKALIVFAILAVITIVFFVGIEFISIGDQQALGNGVTDLGSVAIVNEAGF